jgi:hypothetical protein
VRYADEDEDEKDKDKDMVFNLFIQNPETGEWE